jgi:hypothetical protein
MPFCPDRELSSPLSNSWLRALLYLLLIPAVCPCLLAQTSIDGAAAGSVVDTSGALVVGATIDMVHLATDRRSSTITDAKGSFALPRLPPGDYRLIVEAPGFRQAELSPIVVELGGTANLIVPLSLPGTTVSIDAESGAASENLDGRSGTVTIFPSRQISQFPIDGRQWQSFALLSPEANPDGDDSGLISFRGIASTQNSTQIDGADDDQSFGGIPRGYVAGSPSQDADAVSDDAPDDTGRSFEGGVGTSRHPAISYTFSQEAVQEFRVGAQNYSALQGHAAGGVITTISKGGTDRLHGSAFYTVRSSAFAATNPFSIATHYTGGLISSGFVKPHDLRQQFGGAIGGAALRDKLFYFYTYDQQRRDFPAISTPAYASFYALTPTQTALLGNRGVAGSKITAALTYLDSLTGSVPRRSDQTVNFAKLDWQVSPRNRVTLQENRARSTSPAGVRRGPVVSRGTASLGNSAVSVDSVLARWLWSRGSSLSNEVRFQYGRDLQTEDPQTPLPQEPAIGPGGYAPEVSIGPNGFIFGTPASLGRRAYPDERRLQLADILTFAHGRHLLQVGMDVSFVNDSLQSFQNQDGTFVYDSGMTNGKAGGLVDWITDYTFNVNAYPNGACPSINATFHYFCFRSFTQSFGQQTVAFNTQEWSGFVQETWRVRHGLTLGAGLRYEYELLPLPQHPNPAIDSIFVNVGATSIFPEDRNNFGPRISLAWEPLGRGRGVVHLGYGLYFGRLPGATIRSALVNTATPSSVTHIRLLPTTITACPQVINQGFGYPCAYTAAPPSAIASTTSATVFDRRFRLPALQQGSFGLERELPGGLLTSATYLLSLERQLPNSVDINIAPSTASQTFQLQGGPGAQGVRSGETFAVPIYTQRLTSSFGPVTDILSNSNGSYNALVMEAHRRGSEGFDFRASWTWSKAIDFGQNTGAVPRANAQFDPFTNRYDKALSPLNYPQKVVVAAVWHPNFAVGDHLLRATANGWLISPIFTESSGRPYSYDIFGGTRLTGGHESINGSGGAVYLPTIGPNVLRLPARWRIDMRLSREIVLREGIHLRGIAEAFNLTNHIAYSGVAQRAFLVGIPAGGVTPLFFQDAATIAAAGLNTQPFRTFTAAASGSARERQIQLGLRLEF